MNISGIEKNIRDRRWETISQGWLDSLPRLQFSSDPPDATLQDVAEFQISISSVADESCIFAQDAIELRGKLFEETLTGFLKAAYVLAVMESHAEQGFATWIHLSAYHLAFYSAKSLMGLLGVSVQRSAYKNSDVVIDVWFSNKGSRGGRSACLMICDHQVNHLSLWRLFQRTLRTFQPSEMIKSLGKIKTMDPKRFAKERNKIIYDHGFWKSADLKSPISEVFVTSLFLGKRGPRDVMPKSDAFVVEFALEVFRVCAVMMRDLAGRSPRFLKQAQEVSRVFTEFRYPYSRDWLSEVFTEG